VSPPCRKGVDSGGKVGRIICRPGYLTELERIAESCWWPQGAQRNDTTRGTVTGFHPLVCSMRDRAAVQFSSLIFVPQMTLAKEQNERSRVTDSFALNASVRPTQPRGRQDHLLGEIAPLHILLQCSVLILLARPSRPIIQMP